MSKMLQLARDLSVPATIAARTVFIAGTKGSGKTYSAGVMAEEMLSAGVHVVILDPLGVWWGLRHDARGGPGGFPVVIIGGRHADVPLTPDGGEVVADYVVRSRQPAILDMSGFDSDAEQDRFVTAFLRRLFRAKAADGSPLHLFMDEADLFAPNQPQPGQQVMLGATKAIVTKARSRGISMTMITQRPQSIATVCRDEADVFFCHRIQGPRAAAAVRDWIEQNASRAESATFMDSLTTLDTGECWVWSPHFLKAFGRHRFRRKATFDSSRTPDPGEVVARPKDAAAVDLGRLTADMQATAEAVRANDPAELRRQLAAARADLAKAKSAVPAVAEPKIVERPVLRDGELDRAERAIGMVLDLHEKMLAAADKLVDRIAPVENAVKSVKGWNQPAKPAALAPSAPRTSAPPATAPVNPAGRQALSGPQRKIIDAVAWWAAVGVTRPSMVQVGLVSGYVASGGSFGTYLSALSTGGMIVRDQGTVSLTGDGAEAAERPRHTPTLGELHDRIRSVLSGPHRKLLDAVIEAGTGGMTNEELGDRTGCAATGGSFGTYLSKLSSLGLVDRGRGRVSPSAVVFPATMS